MKNIIKKILVILVVVILGLLIVYWGKVSTSFKVFSILNDVSHYMNEGKENYNILLTGSYQSGNSKDSLNAVISYQKDVTFQADIDFNKKKYIINSEGEKTQVFMGPSNLTVAGNGGDTGNFDVLSLLGEILKSYPQTSEIPDFGFFKKAGISAWVAWNCDFGKGEKNGEEFSIVSLPIDSTEVRFWLNEGEKENYYISVNDGKKDVNLGVTLNGKPQISEIPAADSVKIITIERKELNTAIYRGALRTGGLLLSRLGAPKTDNIEKSYGNGKLIYINGNRVLLAKGTHKEIGKIQGALLKDEIRKMIDATLYTMCWVYTADRKTWFIDDFRDAYKRLLPFIPQRFAEEMEGMAETSGISLDEIQLTNVFPALFHCSGFAVFDSASAGGTLYHGRVLDYIVDLGLQFSAVVYILKPEGYNAFANVGYAGFVGSVTGMNEKQVSFGEMGGRGEGDWDGMPMGFLMRDGMERANTLDEAVTIFSETPRTCEYYYVIADGKIPDARGLSTTPTLFDVIKPNEYREMLDEPVSDAVVMSAGSRYKNLVKRIKDSHGTIDSEKAIRLMDRPVAMKSNLHNALFAPQSLEFWVANAGVGTPASNEPYTYYNFKELLKDLAD